MGKVSVPSRCSGGRRLLRCKAGQAGPDFSRASALTERPFKASAEDFQEAPQRIYDSKRYSSNVEVPVME